MRSLIYYTVIIGACLVASSKESAAQFSHCEPVANCGASNNPCYYRAGNGAITELDVNQSPTAVGTPVIRVRLCLSNSDPMCDAGDGSQDSSSSSPTQQVGILAEMTNGAVKSIPGVGDGLRSNGKVDTGPVIDVEGLKRLRVTCGIFQTSDTCHWIMQVCRRDLPVQTFPLVGADQLKTAESGNETNGSDYKE